MRSKKAYSMGTHFIPALYQQIKLEIIQDEDRTEVIEDAVQIGLAGRALNHKRAIQAEMQRREDLKNEKRRLEEEAAKAKDRRRERRMCLKEQKRIQELVEVLTTIVVPQSEQKEYTPAMPVYDIRDYKEERPAGIYTFGGFIGELVITLASLQEHLMMKNDGNFEVRNDTVMKFLEDLLLDGYPQGVCFINLTADLLSDVEKNEEPAEK